MSHFAPSSSDKKTLSSTHRLPAGSDAQKVWKWSRTALVLYFVVFATLFALVTPPFQAPDEPRHLDYINFVATRHALPDQYDPARSVYGEGHQHPLYYALAAAALAAAGRQPDRVRMTELPPGPAGRSLLERLRGAFASPADRSAFYGLRLLSVLWGALNVLLMVPLWRLFFPRSAWSLLPLLLTVTLPQFLFLSGVVTNDGLADMLVTLTLYLCLRTLTRPTRLADAVGIGLALGLALLTKKTALFLLPGVAAVLLYRAAAGRDTWGGALGKVAAAFACAGALLAPLLLRNRRLYGEWLGTRMEERTLSAIVAPHGLASRYMLREFPRNGFESFVGLFGHLTVLLPKPVYLGYALLLGAGALGLVRLLRGHGGPEAADSGEVGDRPRALLGLSLFFVLLCLAGMVAYNLRYAQPHGRFLFPVLPLIMALTAVGLQAAWPALLGVARAPGRGPRSWAWPALLGVFVVVADLISLWRLHSLPNPVLMHPFQ